MPHRRQYRRNVGGWATLIGVYCIYLGVTWCLFPTSSRASGVEWINESSIPITRLNAYHVAAWWLIGGISSVLGGIFSTHKWCSVVAIVSSIFFPSIVAVIFFGSWVDGSTETGLVSAGSYLFPSAVMINAIWRESRRLRKGLIELPMSDVTGEMEVVKLMEMDPGVVVTVIGSVLVALIAGLMAVWKSRTDNQATNVQNTLLSLKERADKQEERIEKLEGKLDEERKRRLTAEEENHQLHGVIRDQNEALTDWNEIGDYLAIHFEGVVPYTWRLLKERARHEETLARQRKEQQDD